MRIDTVRDFICIRYVMWPVYSPTTSRYIRTFFLRIKLIYNLLQNKSKHCVKISKRTNVRAYAMFVPHRFISWERTLLRDMESSYNGSAKFGRPVVDSRKALRLRFRVGLIKLELNEKEKLLTLSTWTKYVSRGCRKLKTNEQFSARSAANKRQVQFR